MGSAACVIFGGAGYIGSFLVERLASSGRYSRIVVADTQPPEQARAVAASYVPCDVTQPIETQIGRFPGAAIFNLAAVHREPGHAPPEYYRTNILGARNICQYASAMRAPTLVFTSSIAVYGRTSGPTDESGPLRPVTAYGNSKLAAEQIHLAWQAAASRRKLVIVRPGVIFGPGDAGNIRRMIQAVRQGRFFIPGDPRICKSYGYIYGLLDSVGFALKLGLPSLVYNYVERETESLGVLVEHIRREFGVRWPRPPRVPLTFLVAVAAALQGLSLGRTGFHPMRVLKAARSTHIVPARLAELGFPFRYDFASSLRHWKQLAPGDFA